MKKIFLLLLLLPLFAQSQTTTIVTPTFRAISPQPSVLDSLFVTWTGGGLYYKFYTDHWLKNNYAPIGAGGYKLNSDTLKQHGYVPQWQLVNQLSLYPTLTYFNANTGTSTQTQINARELLANKQNSLTTDGTGVKYPTVDAVNGGMALLKSNQGNRVIYDRSFFTNLNDFTVSGFTPTTTGNTINFSGGGADWNRSEEHTSELQ